MPQGSTSFFRGIEPFSKLKKLDASVQSKFIEALDWYVIADSDIVYFERPIEHNFVQAIHKAKDFKKKVWVDYDDDLFNIPIGHPHHSYFNRPDIKKNLETVLNIADVITVTTESLKKEFEKHTKTPIFVIPNAFDDYQFDMPQHSNANPIIAWRGSDTHELDLHEIENGIWDVAKRREDGWSWFFCGCNVQYISRNIKNFQHGGILPLIEYYELMKHIRPAVQIVPLIDNVFNQSKSNIGWLDGMVAGSVCVAPKLPEFDKPGVFTYDSPGKFADTLTAALNPMKREEAFQLSKEYIENNLLLSKVNKKRIEVVEYLKKS